MGLLSDLIANIENTRGQIKRRGLLDLPNIMGEELARRIDPGLAASARMASVVPEVKDSGRQGMTENVLGLLGAIKAYHGSPHKFDKFDMSKIGTGEGAQAYGHGLYFAENPGVANDYAWNLSQRLPDRVKYDGKALSANTMLARSMEDVGLIGKDGALQKLDDSIKFNEKYSPDTANMYRSIRDIIEGVDPAKVNVNKGNTYEVNLRWPDAAREARDPLGPQHFLDWDKPMSDQSEAVRNALQVIGENPTGGQFVNNLGISAGRGKATQVMRDAGIPGIRYLDAGSRGSGSGTHNYVAFDDTLIEILKRNGMAP